MGAKVTGMMQTSGTTHAHKTSHESDKPSAPFPINSQQTDVSTNKKPNTKSLDPDADLLASRLAVDAPTTTHDVYSKANDQFICEFGSYFEAKHMSSMRTLIGTSDNKDSSDTQYSLSPSKQSSQSLQIEVKPSPINTIVKPELRSNNSPYSPYSPVTPVTPNTHHRRSSTYQNNTEFKIIRDNCQFGSCKAIKRIIKILKWHSLTVEKNNNYEALVHKVMDHQYDK
eukprot:315302_1